MDIRAKKSLGQNFLIDRFVLEQIVDVVENGYNLGDKVLRYAKVVIGQ